MKENIMIRLEEKQLEEQVISTGYHIALPFELNRTADGELDLLVYSFCEKIAREFEEKFADDPFGDEAQAFLYEKISPLMQAMDYDCEDALQQIHFEYHAPADLSMDGLCECSLIDDLTGEAFDNLPLDEFTFDENDPCDKMAVVRRDGKIVCYAGLNDISESDGFYEITVECEENYRGNGYAKACVAYLAKHILSCGENVKYVCTSDNVASQKTAEAAGFRLYKTCLPFVCYKFTEDEDEDEPAF